MAAAYYNEIDPYAAQWLRNLINAGHIADGVVDERSIEDVRPRDLDGFTQCHFFAGIGVWSYALRRAGWPDDRPVWTGSCPCQPFSAAGKGAGFDDERHLWPHFHWLIQECRPTVVFGEQVASADAGPWLDLVQDDLEGMGYAFGAVPFPSAGVGAPHIRDRLYWMADANGSACREGRADLRGRTDRGNEEPRTGLGRSRVLGRLADNDGQRCDRQQVRLQPGEPRQASAEVAGNSGTCELGHTKRAGLALGQRLAGVPGGPSGADQGQATERTSLHAVERPGPTNGPWRAADWLACRDGRWRPVEPGAFPLAHGATARVGRLRAYGNAINAEAARVFIKAVIEES